MTRRVRSPRALLILTVCFVGSGLVRLGDPDGALAKEAANLAAAVGAGEALNAMATDAPAACPAPPDPSALLAGIKERESMLSARAIEIADRERLLEAAEAKYRENMMQLEEAEKKLSATLAIADKAADKDVMRLVSVYEAMKPKNAAKIFETMDVTFAAGFIARMNKIAAARVLSQLSAGKAYSVSVVIAGRNARAPTE